MKARGLEFGRARIVKGKGFHLSLSAAERVRAARGVPQAVVKIIGFSRGPQRAQGLLHYISRKGDLPLETESGDQVKGLDQQKFLLKDWSEYFDQRTRSRDLAHVVFSFPRGADPEKLRNAVRTVVTRHFEGHHAAFGIHRDTANPHAHLALVMKNQRDGKKLRLRKPDLHRLREAFAEAAREEGVPLAASPRAARGVGRKGETQAVRQLRHKGIMPHAERRSRQVVLNEAQQGRANVRPWEAAIARRHQIERQAYGQEAERLREAASKESPARQQVMLQEAMDLDKYAHSMPVPQTLRQVLEEKLNALRRSKNRPPVPRRPSRGWER